MFFLKISFQKKIQKKIQIARSAIFFEGFEFFFEDENREAVLGFFFWFFFEDDWRSRYYFLKVVLKMMFCLVLKHKIKGKQRETAEKGLKIFRGRLTAPKTIDLWLFPAKSFETGNFFWRLVIFFWRRKPRSGFSILFWIFFWRPRSGNFFLKVTQILKKNTDLGHRLPTLFSN